MLDEKNISECQSVTASFTFFIKSLNIINVTFKILKTYYE